MPKPRPDGPVDAPAPTDMPKSEAELRVEALIRRQERNLRKARAEGFLAGAAAMLRPGDLALDCEANMGGVTDILARTGADVIALIKLDIEGAELDILETLDQEAMFDRIRVLVAERHERKFKDLRPRFRALRQGFAERHDPSRVNLDWI